MYPQSREPQLTIPEPNANNYAKNVVTAYFRIPRYPRKNHRARGEDFKPASFNLMPKNVTWCHTHGNNQQSTTSAIFSSTCDNPDVQTTAMLIRLGVGEDKWTFDVEKKWLRSLIAQETTLPFSLIKGKIYFFRKHFGSWEPFEFLKHFVVENSANENSADRLVESVFTKEQVESSFPPVYNYRSSRFEDLVVEMTLTVERVSFSKEEECLLSVQAVRMNNALLPIPTKSDRRIKVDGVEFFVHSKQIQAFSFVSETLSKYVSKSDWSDLFSPYSMRALLEFIYFNEVEAICSPNTTCDLMKFAHMYQVSALFKICRERLLTFSEESFTLANLFNIYIFVRIPDEFQQLKLHFCQILSKNAAKYDTTELKQLAKQNAESGVDALVEILQFVAEEEPEQPSTNKRRRI